MANTYELIASTTLASSAQTVTFSSIPSTFTDLVLRASYRISAAGAYGANPFLILNSSGSGAYAGVFIQGNGTTISSSESTGVNNVEMQSADSAGNTANTFTIQEVNFYNYAATGAKSISQFKSSENDSAGNEMHVYSSYWAGTAAINSITADISGTTSFVAQSSFWLYGIKKS
jgi:hypothetical protein